MENAPVRSTLQRSATALSQISFRRLREPDNRRGSTKTARSGDEPQTAVDPRSSQNTLFPPLSRSETAAETLSDGYVSDSKIEEVASPLQRKQNSEREEELKEAIKALNKLSGDADLIVDETLYSILEKVETVSMTISQFQGLLTEINNVTAEHKTHADQVIQESRAQLESFSTLESQQKMIMALGDQVSRSREVVLQHKGRLAAVRSKLEDWEKKEIQWQQRTSRRLRILWGAFSLIVGLLFLLSWTKAQTHHEAVTHSNASIPSTNYSSPSNMSQALPTAQSSLDKADLPQISLAHTSLDSTQDVDRTLRMFDEL